MAGEPVTALQMNTHHLHDVGSTKRFSTDDHHRSAATPSQETSGVFVKKRYALPFFTEIKEEGKEGEGKKAKKGEEEKDPTDHWDKVEEYDVALARVTRTVAFKEAADSFTHINGTYSEMLNHRIEELVDPAEEEIVQVLKLTEITGLPSTTEEITVKGLIDVALVRPRRKLTTSEPLPPCQCDPHAHATGPRLIFSVFKGEACLDMHENFLFTNTPFSKSLEELCCGGSRAREEGKSALRYGLASDVAGEFATMNLRHNVIDAVAYRESSRHYVANNDVNHSTTELAETSCLRGCCDCPCGECVCWTCSLWACCKQCCGDCNRPSNPRMFADQFDASETFTVGAEPKLDASGDVETAGVVLKIQTTGDEKAMIMLQYRSPLNGEHRECTMTLALKEDASDSNARYLEAKKFILTLMALRGSDFEHAGVAVGVPEGFSRESTATSILSMGLKLIKDKIKSKRRCAAPSACCIIVRHLLMYGIFFIHYFSLFPALPILSLPSLLCTRRFSSSFSSSPWPLVSSSA